MNRTKIEYLGYTWNPIVGCVGENCAVRKVCWAKRQAERRRLKCPTCYTFQPHLHPERLNQPFHLRKPSRIGVCFMGDLFDKNVGITWVQMIFRVMEKAKQHTFLVLTKQAANLLNCTENWISVPKNVWLGVTVNRKADLNRIEDLKTVDCESVKFVSFEPLYEDLSNVSLDVLKGIDWIIIGAQTRPNVQPKREWVENLIESADMLHIPVFLKNNLEYPEKIQKFPNAVEGGCSS